jgi:hypothetical protein
LPLQSYWNALPVSRAYSITLMLLVSRSPKPLLSDTMTA